jgi:hypothetical protein
LYYKLYKRAQFFVRGQILNSANFAIRGPLGAAVIRER